MMVTGLRLVGGWRVFHEEECTSACVYWIPRNHATCSCDNNLPIIATSMCMIMCVIIDSNQKPRDWSPQKYKQLGDETSNICWKKPKTSWPFSPTTLAPLPPPRQPACFTPSPIRLNSWKTMLAETSLSMQQQCANFNHGGKYHSLSVGRWIVNMKS